ncbi:MAG TPA: molybdopterin oxidoreductase family protein [Acidimicrobiia bacterium]|nr:molybdopterin oxidoreductase family protein [Acidimicrobiia bacterium]
MTEVRAAPPVSRTALRICPLCEAGCGLEVGLSAADEVVRIRGDRNDVWSAGYLCPKGPALKHLHEDPDRLRAPVVRRDGRFVEVGWDEAFAAAGRLLGRVVAAYGRQALGVYLGNPNVHNLGGQLYVKPFVKALGTRNVFTASTVDQRPKEISSGLLFGAPLSVPVPDIDRTDHLVLLGANPVDSNGSLATAPDWPGRLEAIRARGGRVVVVDPRRTATAEMADEHVAIRPGADPFLLFALLNVLAAEGLVDPGPAGPYLSGLDDVLGLAAPFTPEAVEPVTGVPAGTIRRLARALAAAPTACVYGRIGTTTAEFGTITSWLVDVVNAATGNLDRPGGAMFARAAIGGANTRGAPRFGRGVRLGRHRSRVRGLPESLGELPVVCLAEEIDTPGEGQIRGLVTVAGNPVLSTPNSDRLDAALAGLDAYVAVDPYVNETTRHAHVILPVPSPLERGHYDVFLSQLAVRNVARYTPPVLPRDPGTPDEWEVLARLGLVAAGVEPDAADPALVDDEIVRLTAAAAVADESSPVQGRDADELIAGLGDRRGPERLLDLMLRTGPYGDGFGAHPDGLTFDTLLAAPHGVDLGPLEPRLPDVLRTPSGMVELAPEPLVADVARLRAALNDRQNDRQNGHGMVLIGRRQLRSNNSWMHNVSILVKGKPRCTLLVHPDDADRLGLVDGEPAEVTSRAGAVTIAVEVTEDIRPGVVSIPHGWGHDRPGARLGVAGRYAGVNSNVLAEDDRFDPLSGTAVLNGIPVTVRPARDAPSAQAL